MATHMLAPMAGHMERVSRLTGEFIDRGQESSYRRGQRLAEYAQIRLIWLLALLFFSAYGAVDVLLLSRGLDLFGLRLLILFCGGCAIVLGSQCKTHQSRDLVNFLALLLVSVCYVWLLQRRDMPGNPQGAMLLLVIGIYMFSPGRFLLVCANALFCSILFWWYVGAEMGRLGGWVSHSYLVPANVLAMLALSRLNQARRQVFLSQIRLAREVRRTQKAQRNLRRMHRRSRELLFNALPKATVEYLQLNPGTLPAQKVPRASVIFADIVGFTTLSRKLSAGQLLRLLNRLFSAFDDMLEHYRVEKIKTLGDAYMAVAGAAECQSDHAPCALRFALAQRECCARIASETGVTLQLRIGVHSGPLIAGVIGRTRFAFDVWGETVNLASRLQGAALPGDILVSRQSRDLASEGFHYGSLRRIPLKGCGLVSACTLSRRSVPLQPLGDAVGAGIS